VQAIRHALADSGRAFDDVRVSLEEWPPLKSDASFSGPFGCLPVLVWGDALIAETIPISSFIARELGHYEGLEHVAVAKLEAVISSCYIDVLTRFGEVLWADALYPGISRDVTVLRPMSRVLEKMRRLSLLLPPSGWLGGDRPTVADFFLAEGLEVARYVLGPARDDRLLAMFPRLFAHADGIKRRPAVKAEWARRPARFTASSAEPSAVEMIGTLDLASVGL
jgi:glutathione S-transferase